jgi:glycopeptide antibiotics resistance protein
MRSFMAGVPWFAPGLIVWAVLAVAASPIITRFLRTSRLHAMFLVVAFGLTIMATLTPTVRSLSGNGSHLGTCDLSRLSVAPVGLLLGVSDASLNVLLFVPLGLALGALPMSPRSAALIVGAFLLPVAIELVQLAVPDLGRGCQSADVIDNTMGLVIGLALGFSGHWLLGRRRPT